MITLKYLFYKLLCCRVGKNRNYTLLTRKVDDSFLTLCNKLNKHTKLYYIRFGDGELLAMMGKDHRNYKYNPNLTKELKEAFSINHEQFLIAAPINYQFDQYWAKGVYKPFSWDNEMESLILEEKLNKQLVYENPCIFNTLTAFKPKKVYWFLEKYVRPHSKMFIGGISKDAAEKLYGPIDFYVKTPFKNAYEEVENWWPEIFANAKNVKVILVSVGSSSNIIAKRLWELNVEAHVLDLGSMIDAVEGKVTRTWLRHKGHNINKVLPPQYRERSLSKRFKFILKDIKFFFRNQIV